MQIVRVALQQGGTLYLRDPKLQGAFLVGVECSVDGIAVRYDGCTEDAALMIRRDRIASAEPVR